jgi:hypothetical protein
MRWGAIWLLLSTTVGCGEDQVRWEIGFADDALRARAARVHATIHRGTCAAPGDAAYQGDASPGSAAPPVPDLDDGPWAFAAFAVDDACGRYSFGCTDVVFPTEDRLVVTTLVAEPESTLCEPSACVAGVCGSLVDAGAWDGAVGRDGGQVDASEADGGTVADTGSRDGGSDAGPGTCPHLFCEDFEGGDLSRWRTVTEGSSTVSLEGGAGTGGSTARRAAGPMDSTAAFIERMVFPAGNGDQYLRAMIRLPDNASRGAQFLGYRSTTDQGMLAVQSNSAGGQVLAASQLGGYTDTFREIPIGPWHCVELHLSVGRTGTIAVSVGGVEQLSHSDDTTPGGGTDVRNIAVGVLFKRFDNGEKVVYVDDVIASDRPIGCP